MNTDRNTKVNSTFLAPRYARYVRIIPKAWNGTLRSAPMSSSATSAAATTEAATRSTSSLHAFGCSPTAENTRITYNEMYDPASSHLCHHAPEIETVTNAGNLLTLTGRGFGAGAPTTLELKTPLRFRYGAATDAVCDLTESGRVAQWSQTTLAISLSASSADSSCTAMLSDLAALAQPDLLTAKFQLQLGGDTGCFPPMLRAFTA